MAVEYYLYELYREYFGAIRIPPNIPPDATAQYVDIGGGAILFGDDDLAEMDEPADRTTVLGTPYFMPLILDGYQLPNEPLISITGNNDIIRTKIDGHPGTFKQLFAKGDYSIRIQGIAIDDQNNETYPQRIVRRLRELVEKPGSLKVSNELLSFFGITDLVILDYRFPAVEGANAYQPYEFMCLSDKPFELELKPR